MSINVKNYRERKHDLNYDVVEYVENSPYYPKKIYYHGGWKHIIVNRDNSIMLVLMKLEAF